MNARILVTCVLCGWIGATLVLSQLRWFRRPRLSDRLRPYAPVGQAVSRKPDIMSVTSLREIIGPLTQSVGANISKLFGVSEELSVRLERIHSPLDVGAFRTRQLGWAVAALATCLLLVVTIAPPPPMALLLVLGVPLLTFLVIEQQLAHASSRWQHQVFLELPVVSEQLGMLLSAGYSLGAALNRLSSRGQGRCAQDLARVCGRIRQGLSETAALDEWAHTVDVPAVDRLVAVLSLNREAGDLGHLITEEARSVRRDAQRGLIETIERRGQQVWIPVTVATLVPGVLFLAVPFIEAMRLFTTG